MQIRLNIDWKKTLLISADILLAAYLVLVFVSWHAPEKESAKCNRVFINIADENENGFLKSGDVKKLLENNKLFPLTQNIKDISTRDIEQQLRQMPFVNTAQCYATQQGYVYVTITQRTPVLRVKTATGDDYYIDDNGGVMPNSQYTSDMIIATGNFNRQYAMQQLYFLAQTLMKSDLWSNQIEQINVLPDYTVELTPRVGDHIINIGILPNAPTARKRQIAISDYVNKQMHRLELFYHYGLCHSGWKKYDYISLEFNNQIVCRKRKAVVEEITENTSEVNKEQGESNKATENNKENSVGTAESKEKDNEGAKAESVKKKGDNDKATNKEATTVKKRI